MPFSCCDSFSLPREQYKLVSWRTKAPILGLGSVMVTRYLRNAPIETGCGVLISMLL